MTHVTWPMVVVLAAGILAMRLTGMFVLARGLGNEVIERLARLVPVTVISSVVALQTFTHGRELVLDARVLGVATAMLLAWRKAPLLVVIVAAAAVTALARQLS